MCSQWNLCVFVKANNCSLTRPGKYNWSPQRSTPWDMLVWEYAKTKQTFEMEVFKFKRKIAIGNRKCCHSKKRCQWQMGDIDICKNECPIYEMCLPWPSNNVLFAICLWARVQKVCVSKWITYVREPGPEDPSKCVRAQILQASSYENIYKQHACPSSFTNAWEPTSSCTLTSGLRENWMAGSLAGWAGGDKKKYQW